MANGVLDDKVANVTGSARRIVRATAELRPVLNVAGGQFTRMTT